MATSNPVIVRKQASELLIDLDWDILAASEPLPTVTDSMVKAAKQMRGTSVNIGLDLIKGRSDAVFMSAHTTGLVMASTLFQLGRLPGVDRPPLGIPFPTRTKPVLMLDVGANSETRPEHLHQFALLGSAYVESVWGRPNPKVCLLSNGKEEYKGTPVIREAYKLINEDNRINMCGYAEGMNLFGGGFDVAVVDGFIGNVLLKTVEGFGQFLFKFIKKELQTNPLLAVLAQITLSGPMKRMRKMLDYTEHGGAVMLGVNGNVIILHGRSNSNAFRSSINFALEAIERKSLEKMSSYFKNSHSE